MLTKIFIVTLILAFLSLLVSVRLCNKFRALFMQKSVPTDKTIVEHAEMIWRES